MGLQGRTPGRRSGWATLIAGLVGAIGLAGCGSTHRHVVSSRPAPVTVAPVPPRPPGHAAEPARRLRPGGHAVGGRPRVRRRRRSSDRHGSCHLVRLSHRPARDRRGARLGAGPAGPAAGLRLGPHGRRGPLLHPVSHRHQPDHQPPSGVAVRQPDPGHARRCGHHRRPDRDRPLLHDHAGPARTRATAPSSS